MAWLLRHGGIPQRHAQTELPDVVQRVVTHLQE
jgi:hypothetical protein